MTRRKILDKLKAELTQHYPNITVAVAALDVNDHEQVPKVFAELSDALGGIDRIIVNAGIGRGRRWARASCGPTRRPSRRTWCAFRPRTCVSVHRHAAMRVQLRTLTPRELATAFGVVGEELAKVGFADLLVMFV